MIEKRKYFVDFCLDLHCITFYRLNLLFKSVNHLDTGIRGYFGHSVNNLLYYYRRVSGCFMEEVYYLGHVKPSSFLC